ncbi:NADH-quinone oxidoreductase subunit NuoG [Buchnera aphidicola (Neophyllaphis podocarpi)]|uniref:NADH-quinone oxidoreductase subunit NuoG n=1 Tax=Buchnera aphidicola TaxID=9 RepID=UPI0031B7EF6B
MTSIYIDDKKYQIQNSDNLLHACLSLGFNIPYFCWHPVLGSIGSCRQCAVKEYIYINDKKISRIVMSCMTPVKEGLLISVNDNEAKSFRSSIIEMLMTNHPHDCPICEEGGNCHLQDMTVISGHNIRKYRFNKRTFISQYLGDFISHKMNRCITCYRCVRYYKDYAGGKDFNVYGISNKIYFGRLKDGPLESEFSGNLIEICPTGVFTDKISTNHYSRKWDMQYSPSVCHSCSIGCNIIIGERYGKISRIENRYNSEINNYFICDLGRFGYDYINSDNRIVYPKLYYKDSFIKLDLNNSLNKLIEIIKKSNNIIGIGSSRSSIENNFALYNLVGKKNFYNDNIEKENSCIKLMTNVLQDNNFYTPSLIEIENYDTILILGEDITQTASRMSLSIRQAINKNISNITKDTKNEKYLFITSVKNTKLDDIAEYKYFSSPEEQACFGFAIDNSINDIDHKIQFSSANAFSKIDSISKILLSSNKVLIVSGSSLLNVSIIQAAINIYLSLKKKKLNQKLGIALIPRAVNSIGLNLLSNLSLDLALKRLISSKIDTAIILENDLYRCFQKQTVDFALSKVKNLVVLDHCITNTSNKANIIFPCSSFSETTGTVLNYEGRSQRFFSSHNPNFCNDNYIIDSWRLLHKVQKRLDKSSINWNNLDDVINCLVLQFPKLLGVKFAAPSSSFRKIGQKIARSPHRYSGRTAIFSNYNIHEKSQPQDKDSMFAFSMEGSNNLNESSSHIPFVWYPGINSVHAWIKFNLFTKKSKTNISNSFLKKTSKNYVLSFNYIPDINKNNSTLFIVPYYLLFGSDEMTYKSTLIKKNTFEFIMIINQLYENKLNLTEGKKVSFICSKEKFIFNLQFSSSIKKGLAALPLGMPGIPLSLSGKTINNIRAII